jgi:NADH-quinone oxidoreductase subunit N
MTALIIIFLTALVVLFAGLTKHRGLLQPIALMGTLGALGVTCLELFGGVSIGINSLYPDMLSFNAYSTAFSAVVLLSTALIIGLGVFGFRMLDDTLGDNYALLLFSLCGALCMFCFQNITMLFLGIEILSIPLYVLAGSRRDNISGNEAALKYFLMGAFATGILLFGTALVYGATGSFDLNTIASAIGDGKHSAAMLHVGILMILVGMSFKVSAVPFHFWAPDVYTGSPNLVTAFMATVVKTAGFAAFYKLFTVAFGPAAGFWGTPVAMLAALTMTVANLTALFQTDFKRMIAYSSIAHAGYLLLAVLAAVTPGSAGAILLYTLTYSIATICALGAYMAVTEPNMDGSFDAFNGLEKKSPLLAAALAISMLSLAGVPPTAGFFGKYFLFTSVFEKYPWLVVLAVINSAVSIYYYFKVIIAMYFTRDTHYEQEGVVVPTSVRWVVFAGIVLIAVLAIVPGKVYGLLF